MARPQGNKLQAEEYYLGRWYDPSIANVLHDFDNSKDITFADAADNFSIFALQGDADARIQLDRGATMGARQQIPFYFNAAPALGGLGAQHFFVNCTTHNIIVTGISEIHATAENAAGTSTAVITHDLSGQAPGAGTVLMTNTFNLKATANTVQTATLLAVDGLGRPNTNLILKPGDRLSVLVGGSATPSALAGCLITVSVAPGTKESLALYNMLANGSIATQGIFLANRDLVATSVWMVWSTAGTNGGTVTADLTLENTNSGTPAVGSGTSILAAAQSVKLTANVPVQVALSGTAANLLLRAGYRLSLKMTGTLTALAGLVVGVAMGPSGGPAGCVGEVDVTFQLNANGSQATQGFWIADQDYEVADGSLVAGTASTSGTVNITIDKGVTAPGGGTAAFSATMSTATANTVQVGTLSVSRRNRLISAGDKVSVLLAGTLGSGAGYVVALTLKKA